MDLKEVLDSVITGLTWLAIGGGTYFGIILGSQALFGTTLFRKKIESQEELESIIEEEAEKLFFDHTLIDAVFGEKFTGARKIGERYDLFMEDCYCATRAVVKHELYHIVRGDCDREYSSLRYYFISEPRATLYGITSIKL